MNIRHHWTLQEISGSSVADSIGSNHGVVDGSVTLGVAGPGGSSANAAEFSGTSTTPIVLADEFRLSRKHDWSLEFWAKQDSANNKGMVLGDSATTRSFVWLSSTANGLRVRPVEGTDASLDLDFLVPTATRTKWTHYRLVHDVSGASPSVSLYLDETLSETLSAPNGIGLVVNAIGSGHTSSTFAMDGMLSNVQLSGTLVDFTAPDKIVLVLGQSNAEGRFDNNQVYEHPTLYASVFADGQWAELIDTDSNGEVWPLVATHWLSNRNESVGFIYAAVGGTGLVDQPDWAAGGTTYDTAIAAVDASGASRIDAVLWFQGERDANQGVSREDYAAAMHDLVARLHGDLPSTPLLLCGQIDNVQGGIPDEIRKAQVDAWGNSSILPGPVTYDVGPLADGIHFTTDAEAVTLANRWWAAIDEALYDGTVGTPPSLVSAEIDGLIVTLTYDRALEAAANYDVDIWEFRDNVSSIAVVDAVRLADCTVELTLASVPTTSAKTIELGQGGSSQGKDVPRGLGSQPALPDLQSVTLAGLNDPTVTGVREVVRVKKIQREISIV